MLPPVTAPPSSASLNGILGSLLANPALLSALPSLLSGLSAIRPSPSSREDTATSVSVDDHTSEKSVKVPEKKAPTDRHTALLCALKPYLSSERRQATEYLLGMCRLWDTLRTMGINLPAMLTSGQEAVTEDRTEEV